MMALNNAGEVLCQRAAFADARTALDESLGLARWLGVSAQVSDTHRLLGIALCALGHSELARGAFDAALALANTHGERQTAAFVALGHARLCAGEGDLAAAGAHADRGFGELGDARPALARYCLEAAQVFAATADGQAQARRWAGEAERRMRELGIDGSARQAAAIAGMVPAPG